MLSPRSVGQIAAIAGRSMPGSGFRQNFAIAISAPVLPAETAAPASRSRTAWIGAPHRRLPAPLPKRLARLVVHLHASRRNDGMSDRSRTRGLAFEHRPHDVASSPKTRKRRSGRRSAAIAAPPITTSGPASPPMASREIVIVCRHQAVDSRAGGRNIPLAPRMASAKAARRYSWLALQRGERRERRRRRSPDRPRYGRETRRRAPRIGIEAERQMLDRRWRRGRSVRCDRHRAPPRRRRRRLGRRSAFGADRFGRHQRQVDRLRPPPARPARASRRRSARPRRVSVPRTANASAPSGRTSSSAVSCATSTIPSASATAAALPPRRPRCGNAFRPAGCGRSRPDTRTARRSSRRAPRASTASVGNGTSPRRKLAQIGRCATAATAAFR